LLAERRKQKGLSQAKLAEKIGKTKSQISDWENDRFVMEIETAKAIAIVLDCVIDDLYEWGYVDPAEQDSNG
jgi:transcriptional regulator with XRE-family HTH domain